MAIKFTNSEMVDYVKISPFKNVDRIDDKGVQHAIEVITWHHTAGVVSVETLGDIMTRPGRNMSATYGIGYDARVGRYLDEKDRPWTSSSRANDFKAVTIEISNSSTGGDWPISDAVMEKAIALTVDICKRNGIKKLVYTGDATGNFTFHKMFAATGCPGPYIESRAKEIVKKINSKLNSSKTKNDNVSTFKVGDLVSIDASATYYDGGSIPSWVKEDKWYISSIKNKRAVLGLNEKKNRNIQSPINTKFLSICSATPVFKSYTISLKATDVIYKDPTNIKGYTSKIGKAGVYTIIEEKTVSGVKYGKLKSGAGWVKLNTSTNSSTKQGVIKKGDKVKVANAVQYNGKSFKVYASSYTVLEVKGDRVVISADGKNVTAAVNSKNLEKL